ENDHDLSRVSGPDRQGAEKTNLFPKVEERYVVTLRLIFRCKAYGVRRIRLEMTLVDIKHLVVFARNVITQRWFILHFSRFHACYLTIDQIAFVKAGEIQFISIIP